MVGRYSGGGSTGELRLVGVTWVKGAVLFRSGSELQVPFSGKRSRGPEETDCITQVPIILTSLLFFQLFLCTKTISGY